MRQVPHRQVPELHHAALIMLLQGQQTLYVSILRIYVIDHHFIVHFDDDMVAARDHILCPPRVVRDELLLDVRKAVQAARASPILMRVVHLRFVALRPFGSELRAEIHAGVAAVVDLHLRLELAIPALVLHVKQVTALPIAHDLAVLHRPTLGVVARLPAVQRLAVEHADPSAVVRGKQASRRHQSCAYQAHLRSHGVNLAFGAIVAPSALLC